MAAAMPESRMIGTPTIKLLYRHVLPNTVAPLIVQGTYVCASAILVEAILSFLGAGISPETPTWGNIMAEGRVFDRSLLSTVEQALIDDYFGRGKYAVKVDSDVRPLPRNRVAISLDISEGVAARIRRINIVGNIKVMFITSH